MKIAIGLALTGLCGMTLRADFSYQQTAAITGGALAGLMKFAGAFSKQAREPIVSRVSVKGHRIAYANTHTVQISDLDKETITNIDLDRKTYSVMTFEQMKQQFEQMSQKAQAKKADGKDVDMNMNVSAKNTGQTKDIDGLVAKELMLTMTVQGTDPKTGQTGGMDIRSDMWMAKVPGYDEVRELQKLMGEKLGFVTGGSVLPMQRPELVKNMGELYKEIGKLEGMPIETVVAMGGIGMPSEGTANSNAASSSNDSSSTAQPKASDDAVATAMSRLGGLAGGFGGFGRKKQKPEDSAGTRQTGTPAKQTTSTDAPGSLIEMTTRSSQFSTSPVDESHFAVPDGFKQVQHDTHER